jgi:hypothetical protein
MKNYFNERRKYNSTSPYIYFFLEQIIYMELLYFIYALISTQKIVLIIATASYLYLLSKSLKRLSKVLKRCERKELYKKHQTKIQEKIRKDISK